MNAAEPKRLPSAVAELIELAAMGYAERARLYVLLALGVFVLCATVYFAWPAGPSSGIVRGTVIELLDVFASSFVICTVALGVATRVAGDERGTRALLGITLERWLAVLGACVIVQFVFELTVQSGLPARGPSLTAFDVAVAPLAWLLWGALGLAGPVAALNGDPPSIAIVTGFFRALLLAFAPQNLGRLCLLTLITLVPVLSATMIGDALRHLKAPDVLFWAGVPMDALAVGPFAALQTVFALDFARRAAARPR